MADIVYVAVTAAFFYLTWLFVKLCDAAVGRRTCHSSMSSAASSSLGLLVYLTLALLKPELFQ